MDNFRLELIANSKDDFVMGITLAFRHTPGNAARGYRAVDVKQRAHHPDTITRPTLVLYWHSSDEAVTPLPYDMKVDQAIEFAWGWLLQANYPEEPDIDGSAGKGFRLYNEDWGHVLGNPYAFLGIQPEWALYGK